MKIIPLPPNMKFEDTTANFTNSILTITISKNKKKAIDWILTVNQFKTQIEGLYYENN